MTSAVSRKARANARRSRTKRGHKLGQQAQLNWIANFIWGIADDVLRDLYVRGKYRDVILPMTVRLSEGLLETWAVREAFLLFCLLLAPDPPTWRAWLAYENSSTGRGYKATQRNAGAYLQLLEASNDRITSLTMEALVREPREQRRGAGGTTIWDRAQRFLKFRKQLEWDTATPPICSSTHSHPDRWIGPDTLDADTARLDMSLLLDRAMSLFADAQERKPEGTGTEQLRMMASGLRQHIATREPFATEADFDIQVATLWGAKGVTADHVYILGACDEAIPGERRDEYPGTDTDFVEEQRRLFTSPSPSPRGPW